MLTANVLGASIYSDIFFIAFKIPNLFRNIFAEGAFSQSFIPSLAASKNKGLFCAGVFSRLFLIIFLLSLLVTIGQSVASYIFAFGYDENTKRLAAPIIAINFWYLDLIFIVTFLGAILQYRRHFAVTAFATALLNVAMIVALLIAQNMEKMQVVYALCIGVLAGGVLQVAAHLIVARKKRLLGWLASGFVRLFSKKSTTKEDASRFNRAFLPSIAGSSTAQIAAFVDTWLATFLGTGAISYLYYANRIFQLPLAVFAIATSIALFPSVAKLVSAGRQNDALAQLSKAFWFLSFMLTGFAIGGIMLSSEVISLIYERGAFVQTDTLHCSAVLAMYMLGLLPFGLSRLFSLWLYSNHQQMRAAKISGFSLLMNALASIILMQFLGAAGLALSGSLTGCLLFFLTLRAFGFDKFFAILKRPRMIALLLAFAAVEILILMQFKTLIA